MTIGKAHPTLHLLKQDLIIFLQNWTVRKLFIEAIFYFIYSSFCHWFQSPSFLRSLQTKFTGKTKIMTHYKLRVALILSYSDGLQFAERYPVETSRMETLKPFLLTGCNRLTIIWSAKSKRLSNQMIA